MDSSFLQLLRESNWVTWLPIIAGLLVVGLIFVGAQLVSSRRRHARELVSSRRRTHIRPVKTTDPFLQGSHSERRGSPRRHGNPVPVLVSDATAQVEPVRALVQDRSDGGLCLELTEEGDVDVGTILSVRPVSCPTHLSWVPVEVRNRRQVGSTWWLGCRYVRRPSWDLALQFG